jgi:signal transduction histidine kinase
MAIMAAQEGQSTTKECRITYKNGDYTEALDLNVSTSRFDIEDHTYTFFSIVDISSDKRRQALERIFFHDVLNTAGSLHTTIELLLSMKDEADQQELLALLPNVSQKLINEVRAQLELVKAEKGDLHVQQHVVNSLQLLEEVVAEYKYVNYQDHCTIQISENPLCTSLITDNHLIKRVIGNMLKNAIEASGKGDVVMLGCEQMTPESVTWYVTNPKFIPREIQLQIFNRTYSTKGLGRGLGTYSMKLIAERYLKGKVRFSSDPERGTRFELTLPISQS